MAINLVRNSKVYLTTAVDSVTGLFTDGPALTSASTFELQVLDGYSFSQNTETQQITVNEAGTSPVRGSRTFNTALAPVDWSITTYVRPVRVSGVVQPAERLLWNAIFSDSTIDSAGTSHSGISRANTTAAIAIVTAASTGLNPGEIIHFNGNTSTAAVDLNQSAIVRSTGATTMVVEFMKAPGTAVGSASAATGRFYRAGWAAGASGVGSFSYTSTMNSQRNQLQKFAMLFSVDNVVYCVDNCAVTQASIDFGLDQIAQIAWTGQGSALRQLTAITAISAANVSTAISTASYITNKLSTMTLQSKIGGSDNTASTSYTVAITGGNLTINNNITYLTPTNLGVVNSPITYFTGNRSITGNVTAYLKTGTTGDAGSLLTALLSGSSSDTEPKFKVGIQVGATTSQTAVPRLDFEMNGAMLQIPTVEIQDVVSTTINFVAQPFNPDYVGGSNNAFDLERSNELLVRYWNN